MNKELIEKITKSSEKLLEFIEKAGESTIEFTKEQTPLLIKEILDWGFYNSLFHASLNLLVFLSFIIIFMKTYKYWFKEENNEYAPGFVIPFIYCTPGIICFFVGVAHLSILIKIQIAPRLYLLETIKTFL